MPDSVSVVSNVHYGKVLHSSHRICKAASIHRGWSCLLQVNADSYLQMSNTAMKWDYAMPPHAKAADSIQVDPSGCALSVCVFIMVVHIIIVTHNAASRASLVHILQRDLSSTSAASKSVSALASRSARNKHPAKCEVAFNEAY